MRLAVNIDHFATLREARKAGEPEPVLVALLAEQAGAHGIVCHIRADRRHIKERDLRLLREAVKTKLNVEMAATEEMKRIALEVRPDVVSLVPERPEELTTEGGLKVVANRKALGPHVEALAEAGIRTSVFIDTSLDEISAARDIGVDLDLALALVLLHLLVQAGELAGAFLELLLFRAGLLEQLLQLLVLGRQLVDVVDDLPDLPFEYFNPLEFRCQLSPP